MILYCDYFVNIIINKLIDIFSAFTQNTIVTDLLTITSQEEKMNMENYTKQAVDKASEVGEYASKEIKKSGNDWLEYVEGHPLQTMMFGLAIFFAIKGLFK